MPHKYFKLFYWRCKFKNSHSNKNLKTTTIGLFFEFWQNELKRDRFNSFRSGLFANFYENISFSSNTRVCFLKNIIITTYSWPISWLMTSILLRWSFDWNHLLTLSRAQWDQCRPSAINIILVDGDDNGTQWGTQRGFC